MAEIQGSNKISISQVLKNSKDVQLFEQESIQLIIDYKWKTYTVNFFKKKFMLYIIYMATFSVGCQLMLANESEAVNEAVVGLSAEQANDKSLNSIKLAKDEMFWLTQIIGLILQAGYFVYELLQAKTEGSVYWSDGWNYLELFEPIVFVIGFILKLENEHMTDGIKHCLCMSCFLTLMKFLNLVRCFREMSYLVVMIEQVVVAVGAFIVLFIICLVPFSVAFQVLNVDKGVYPRFSNFNG